MQNSSLENNQPALQQTDVRRSMAVLPMTGGWYRVQCSCCLQKFNAGRPGNGAGFRWARQEALDWFKAHKC